MNWPAMSSGKPFSGAHPSKLQPHRRDCVQGLDQLVLRDRPKVRLDVAVALERAARQWFSADPTAFAGWTHATESSDEARRIFEAADAEYRRALALSSDWRSFTAP